jgi:hypothetical protein
MLYEVGVLSMHAISLTQPSTAMRTGAIVDESN